MPAYPFQARVAQHLQHGRSVILQAPTGAGKTRAALWPYLDALFKLPAEAFPRRCVYAVPMRVLANQFENEYKHLMAEYYARFLSLNRRAVNVSIQTGARAKDRTFEGDLIFTTIDQVLSNFLAIPYALSNGKANLNAAAVFGSYLIFDEFHLFPVGANGSGALGTTLEMLRWLKGITPFVLMTATFSETMVDRLCTMLDAEKVTLSAEELAALPSQNKTRGYHLIEAELTADAVLAAHTGRSIAICNTVQRAQDLYRALVKDPRSAGIRIELLHSRFLQTHRIEKEEWTRREFGPQRTERQERSAILVATQVVEVGLDITCENLHTELAPANSVLQRAGRCARYEGETGNVYVYRLPVNSAGQPRTAPYLGGLCQATWDALTAQTSPGPILGYQAEMAVVNAVHTGPDTQLLDVLGNTSANTRGAMEAAIGGPDRGGARGLARELIRNVDNATVVLHPDPGAHSVAEPWAFEGFGLYRGSLLGAVPALLARADALRLAWAIRVPCALPEAENSREPTVYKWLDVREAKELRGQTLVFVHPALAAYDAQIGFRFVLDETDTAGNSTSPPVSHQSKEPMIYSYRVETYKQHIGRLWMVYRRDRGDEVAWVARRLEERLGLSAGLMDRAIRLTLACHDAGKLTEEWQGWAHEWQRQVGHPIAPNVMLAHTFYDPSDPGHRALDKQLRGKRPHHAVEGALAAAQLARIALGETDESREPHLTRAVVTAIARHHNADSVQANAFRLHGSAAQTLQEVLDVLRAGADWRADTSLLRCHAPACSLSEQMGLVPQGDTLGQLLYFLLVRVLRLSDQEAVKPSGEAYVS